MDTNEDRQSNCGPFRTADHMRIMTVGRGKFFCGA